MSTGQFWLPIYVGCTQGVLPAQSCCVSSRYEPACGSVLCLCVIYSDSLMLVEVLSTLDKQQTHSPVSVLAACCGIRCKAIPLVRITSRCWLHIQQDKFSAFLYQSGCCLNSLDPLLLTCTATLCCYPLLLPFAAIVCCRSIVTGGGQHQSYCKPLTTPTQWE